MQTLSNRFNLGSKKPVTGFSTRRPLVNLCVKRICLVLMLSFVSCCSGVPVVGLHPEYPPVKKKTFSLYSEFVEVNSLQPTFRWQPFPGPEDDFADRIHDVTYELRIWTTVPRRSGKLRYARDGLELASHMLEKPLEPSKQYLWSIRACFIIDGKSRMTEWGMAGIPLRNESVSNLSCFRFKTPEK